MAQTSRNVNYRPDFRMCGKFSGEQGLSAEKWLKKFEYDMHGLRDVEGNILPSDYLASIEILLADQAEIWAESTPQVAEILHKALEVTKDDVTTFQLLFKLQYPGRVIESTNLNVDAEISKLGQQAGENLGTYYKRANSLLMKAGSRDRERQFMTIEEALKGKFAPLSPSENTVLDSIIRAFIRGISDTTVRADTLRGLVATQRSQRGAYTIAEESKKLKEELVLMEKLEQEQNELEFLRRMVKGRVSSEPIPELMKSYTRQTSVPFPLPTAYNTCAYLSTFQFRQQLAQPQAPPPVRAQSNSPIPHRTSQPQADQKQDNAPFKKAAPYQSHAPAGSLPPRTASHNPFINESTKYHQGMGMLCVKCGDLGHKSNVCTKPAITNWERAYLKEIVFGIGSQVGYTLAGFQEDWRQGNVSPQSDSSKSQEEDVVGCHGALPAASDAKSVTYIFSLGRREKDMVATVGNTGLHADTLISEGKRGIDEVDSNPPAIGPPSLRPGVNQEILEHRDKRKALKRIGKKKELRPITGLLNDNMVLEKPILARKLLRSNMITISELDLMVWSPTLCNEFKRLLTRKSRSKMAKAKVVSATAKSNVAPTEATDPS